MGFNKRGKRTTQHKQLTLLFFDTNFLMALAQMPSFNISHELDRIIPGKKKLIVLKPVYLELETLSREGRPKVQKEARIAIEFVQKHCVQEESNYEHKNVDFILLHNSEVRNGIIATNDRKLKRMAQKRGVKIVYIRNKRFLELKK
ncbi:MAG: PIN domain-containing protein [Candidatus Hodarchaeota archaeon]